MSVVVARGAGAAVNGTAALRGLDFVLHRGETVVVVGENGAGKSALVALLAGIIRPTAGDVEVFGEPPRTRDPRVAVVWQEPALCLDMTALDNLLLGRESPIGWVSARTRRRLQSALDDAGFPASDLDRPVGELSPGRRQQLALARALVGQPELLLLDEPTSALSLAEHQRFEGLVRRLRAEGTTILLTSHRVAQAALADRVIALRQGELVADASSVELTADDIAALMAGHASGSGTRRHLSLLGALVEQLADVEPSASLPVIVSGIANTLGRQQIAVHLLEPDGRRLVLRAALGLSAVRSDRVSVLPVDDPTTIGRAYRSGETQVEPRTAQPSEAVPASMWSVPIIVSGQVHGVITVMADATGHPPPDQLDTAAVYAGFAAAALERESMLRSLSASNSMLESLRRVTDALAGGEQGPAVDAALDRLGTELVATEIALVQLDDDDRPTLLRRRAQSGPRRTAAAEPDRGGPPDPAWRSTVLGIPIARLASAHGGSARRIDDALVAAADRANGRLLLVALDAVDGDEAEALAAHAAWAFAAAADRDEAGERLAEAKASERTSAVQREFVHRLSHELRTPLTTILGYASSLQLTDVDWDGATRARFIDRIRSESIRMRRLVRDLLDSSTLAAGTLPLVCDWCDLSAIAAAALDASGADSAAVTVDVDGVGPVWGDHERLQQVFINAIDNAFRHGAAALLVSGSVGADGVVVDFRDDGPGVHGVWLELAFAPYEHGDEGEPGLGLGLSISRGIAEAHGGTLTFRPSDAGAHLRLTLPVEPRDRNED